MLAKKYRLHQSKEIRKIHNQGRSFSSDFLVIKFLPNFRLTQPRVGIIISKKISPKATLRNKIKRQISHIFNQVKEKLPNNLEMIVIVKKPPQDFESLEQDLLASLQRTKII